MRQAGFCNRTFLVAASESERAARVCFSSSFAVQARLPGQRSRRLPGEGHDPGPKPRPKQTRSEAAIMAQISRPTRARVALEAPEVLVVMRLLKSFRETLVAKRPGQAPPTQLKTITVLL